MTVTLEDPKKCSAYAYNEINSGQSRAGCSAVFERSSPLISWILFEQLEGQFNFPIWLLSEGLNKKIKLKID